MGIEGYRNDEEETSLIFMLKKVLFYHLCKKTKTVQLTRPLLLPWMVEINDVSAAEQNFERK